MKIYIIIYIYSQNSLIIFQVIVKDIIVNICCLRLYFKEKIILKYKAYLLKLSFYEINK